MKRYESWGKYPNIKQQAVPVFWSFDDVFQKAGKVLPYGLGRSYGDSCLIENGTLLDTEKLDHFISFDPERGVLACESGVSLEAILELVVPSGWFLPVTPGTKFVTVGGAIANDVHGKNHHAAGTFGCHVRQFELLRSDGRRYLCSPDRNRDFFAATIGGLGLTGLITWAEIQLQPIESPNIDAESIKFTALDEFFRLSEESKQTHAYSVAWIDSTSKQLRGHFIRGNHSKSDKKTKQGFKKLVPADFPSFSLNPLTVGLFNFAYFNKQRKLEKKSVEHYGPFFYPLDSVLNWNRIYGKKGFFQWQCVVPFRDGRERIETILSLIKSSKLASFLSVMKVFGDIPSPGMLSFPREGVTLAMDFPNRGEKTKELFNRLDKIVVEAGGAIYPAKDARMSPETFRASFPRLNEFSALVDPKFSSCFWERVNGEKNI